MTAFPIHVLVAWLGREVVRKQPALFMITNVYSCYVFFERLLKRKIIPVKEINILSPQICIKYQLQHLVSELRAEWKK